ncbi:MAG: tyrosine-type recombinase/integrase [Clostridium paraputrificum]
MEELAEKIVIELKKNGYRDNTIRCYKNSIKRFFYHFFDYDIKMTNDNIKNYLENIKNKSELSQVINSIRILKSFDKRFDIISEKELKEITKEKKKNRIKRYDRSELKKVLRKVNSIRNDNLRLGFRLLLVSGLRIFELSALKKGDILFLENGLIRINVVDGKGGKSGTIDCLKDNYLYKNLKDYLEQKEEKESVFYAPGTFQKKAKTLGIKCHDFRRAYSKLVAKNINKANIDFPEDIRQQYFEVGLKRALRHERIETSYKYLYSKRIKI